MKGGFKKERDPLCFYVRRHLTNRAAVYNDITISNATVSRRHGLLMVVPSNKGGGSQLLLWDGGAAQRVSMTNARPSCITRSDGDRVRGIEASLFPTDEVFSCTADARQRQEGASHTRSQGGREVRLRSKQSSGMRDPQARRHGRVWHYWIYRSQL